MARPKKKGTIYALDVSFFTFRAYYALPPLSSASGVPTNAIHGVASMIESLIKAESPEFVVAAFDSPGDTFRNEIYADYKANRDEPDEDLRVQFPYVRRMIESMSICCLADPRYEADDILATIAKRFGEEGYEVVLVTGDKDLMQCVNDRVSLFDPVRNKRVRDPQVLEKFGVRPDQVVDVQGLMGDSTDNIPGIRGVGPKTATALIQHFGSLDELEERLDEVSTLSMRGAAGVQKKLVASFEDALVSRRLATAATDVVLDVDIEDLELSSIHTQAFLDLTEELDMKRMSERLRSLLGVSEEVSDVSDQGEVEAGADTEPFENAVEALGDLDGDLGVILTEDVDGRSALAVGNGRAVYWAAGDDSITAAWTELQSSGHLITGYDLKSIARRSGQGPTDESFDVGLAAYLSDPTVGSHDAAAVVERYLEEGLVDPSGGARAANLALGQLMRASAIVREQLDAREQSRLYKDIESPLIAVLAAIEHHGILLDVSLLKKLSTNYQRRMTALVEKIYDAAGTEFNVLSPVQLRTILFDKLELPTKGIKKTKTGPSTDSDSLHALAELHPLPNLVLEYRGLAKLKSTYIDALPKLVDENSRVHTSLNQTVTATGRLSSADPNLQNIPIRTEDGARIREAFVAAPGHKLISADYNQIELRVLADLSEDEALCGAFHDGVDIHRATSAEVFGVELDKVDPDMRRAAKVINYGIIYGMGPVRMSRELGIKRSEASEYIEQYFARYPGVQRFYDEMLAHAQEFGYVATRYGRRRYLPDIDSDHGGRRQAAERVATNTPIQGSAADIIKIAMVRLAADLDAGGYKARMILQIHDELLVECPDDEVEKVSTVTRTAMENAAELAVPIVVDVGVGDNWAAAH